MTRGALFIDTIHHIGELFSTVMMDKGLNMHHNKLSSVYKELHVVINSRLSVFYYPIDTTSVEDSTMD